MNVKTVIAAMILGGAMVNFSSCENEEMKSQMEKMLENDSISKANLATLQKLLEKTQSELQNAKAENAISGNDFEKFQSMLNELENSLQNENASKLDLEKLKKEIESLDKDLLVKILYTNGHDYVDLGLPSGNLWATVHLEKDNGDLYQWGETNEALTEEQFDNKYASVFELELEDDIAHVEWGGKWRIPSKEDFDELKEHCTWTWNDELAGCEIKSNKNGNSIFLHELSYWTRSRFDNSENAQAFTDIWCFKFVKIGENEFSAETNNNSFWFSDEEQKAIRPVCNLK